MQNKSRIARIRRKVLVAAMAVGGLITFGASAASAGTSWI